MISFVKGAVQWKNETSVVVTTNGVGFEVFLSKPALEKVKIGEEREFFTHEYLRENSRELYGFLTRDELSLFFELLKVSSVGPKTALNVMSLGAGRVQGAINKGDAAIISSVSGVGKKTAQKIILELKGVLADAGLIFEESEALEALRSLGYSQSEAMEALKKIGDGDKTVEEKIRAALKILGKR
ncbi:MAG: Holliday junction branch migration protein RuvA [bacterium]|nr:Holliday junction branch migration protein RuvA [bacterium]